VVPVFDGNSTAGTASAGAWHTRHSAQCGGWWWLAGGCQQAGGQREGNWPLTDDRLYSGAHMAMARALLDTTGDIEGLAATRPQGISGNTACNRLGFLGSRPALVSDEGVAGQQVIAPMCPGSRCVCVCVCVCVWLVVAEMRCGFGPKNGNQGEKKKG
jgi:hypothetical protein